MVAIRDRPILTDVYQGLGEFVPQPGSAYIYGTSAEKRSAHSSTWEQQAADVGFFPVLQQEDETVEIEVMGSPRLLALRSGRQLSDFWLKTDVRAAYLDITGLAHHIWAPLLRSALSTIDVVRVVYVEPQDYTYSSFPTEGEIFDLSEKIKGIAPIPGFASLRESREADICFVPLLGFEGPRLAYLLESVQPPRDRIVPIVGVPGFRPEYPFHTYQGNRLPLIQNLSWKNVRFAIANCPFSLFYTLQDIAASYAGNLMKIAPIGTKPHALGAVLYAMTATQPVELVYDHPIRKATRTTGSARALIYHVSALGFSGRG